MESYMDYKRFRENAEAIAAYNFSRDQPVTLYSFTVRALNVFAANGIKTMGDPLDKSSEELLNMPNFGVTTLKHVNRVIQNYERTEEFRDEIAAIALKNYRASKQYAAVQKALKENLDTNEFLKDFFSRSETEKAPQT